MEATVSTTKDLLRPSDIAKVLGVTPARVYQLLAEGSFPVPTLRIGRARYIPAAAWQAWLAGEKRSQEPGLL